MASLTGRAQGGQQGYRGDLLVCQVGPLNAGRGTGQGPSPAVDDAPGRDDQVDGDIVTGHRDLPGGPQLDLVHRGDDDGLRPDQACGGGQGELQVGEAAAFAQP